MKEKIELFAKGVFAYERPALQLSIDSISISVESGKLYRGSFVVSSSDKSSFKGLLYSSSGLLTFEKDSFIGAENTVYYTFNATYLDRNDQNSDRNDQLKGRISIVTELGENFIPFKVSIRPPVCETSIGPASDLFHYASLAQTNWSEAKNLFKSDDFHRTFSYTDPKFDTLHRALVNSANTSVAVEEFLTAAHKKLPVTISADTLEISHDSLPEDGLGSLLIKKDNWGFSQLSVDTDGDFISTETRIIWTEDFDGNTYKLSYRIDPDKLHAGVNHGRILIRSIRQTLEIRIIYKNLKGDLKSLLGRRRKRHFEINIMSEYLDYRMERILPARFVADAEKALDILKTFRPEQLLDRLIRIYLLIISGRFNQATLALGVIEEDEEWNGYPDYYYGLVLYLDALSKNNPQAAVDGSTSLRELFEHTGDPRIYLMSFLLDKRKRMSNSTRFETLRRCFDGRPVSANVLFEAALILNEEPTVLRDFSGFDLQVINFAVRNQIINRNAVQQAAYLASKTKTASPLSLRVLKSLFASYKMNEVLEAYCSHLILAQRRDQAAFDIYNLAVIEQLNIRNLYEYCLASAGEALTKALPKQLVSYFASGIELDDARMTAFYANIVSFRSVNEDLPPQLLVNMGAFTARMMVQGRINRGLAVLYNKVLRSEDVFGEAVYALPEIIYKHMVQVEWESAAWVLVMHKEQDREKLYPLEKGIAYVDIYTEDPEILLLDEQGNRIASEHVTVTRLINNPELIALCNAKCSDDERVILHSLDEARYKGTDSDTISLIKRASDLPGLENSFRIECFYELIEHYYDSGEGELMESYLIKLDLASLDRQKRSRIIDLMILRDLYSLAMTNIELYGFTGVEINRLTKLVTKLIEINSPQTHSKCFLDICVCAFRKRKFNDKILTFLVNNYMADTESMYSVWAEAGELGVDGSDMEERLLQTVLFTESDMSFGHEVFKRYYGHSSPNRLIRAFLSYYAYGYLACNRVPDVEMLELMRREVNYEENDICMLAILKSYSTQKSFAEPDRMFIERQLERMDAKGMVYPFFKNFPASVKIPPSMQDKCYVEYHTDPRKRVRIHYLLADSGSDNYIVEDMTDLGYGIFVKEFVVFYGEALQYYISEEYDDHINITEASQLSVEMDAMSDEESRYHRLNLIITAREMDDNKTMQKMLEQYIRTDYMIAHLFKPIL